MYKVNIKLHIYWYSVHLKYIKVYLFWCLLGFFAWKIDIHTPKDKTEINPWKDKQK